MGHLRTSLALALALALGAAAVPRSEAPCPLDEARRWVEQHPEALPTSLADLAAFDVVYRRAIYAASSWEVRTSLWEEHIELVLTHHPGLEEQQVTFLMSVKARLRGLVSEIPDDAALREIQEQAVAILGQALAAQALGTLGPASPTLQSGGEDLRIDCNCSFESEWCGVFQDCWLGGCENATEWGCGTLWVYACNGYCSS